MNPYLLFPSLALSTSALENMVVLLVVMFASHGMQYFRLREVVTEPSTTCPGNRSLTLLLLAVLVQVSLFYTVLLAPITILSILGPASRLRLSYQLNMPRLNIALTLGQFLGFSVLLTAVSGLAAGNWSWLSQTWGARYASSCLPLHILTLYQFHAS